MAKPLSFAAQAVLDAAERENSSNDPASYIAAAALRAAAAQLSDEMIVVGEGFKGLMRDDWSIIHTEDLLAIAYELESLQD